MADYSKKVTNVLYLIFIFKILKEVKRPQGLLKNQVTFSSSFFGPVAFLGFRNFQPSFSRRHRRFVYSFYSHYVKRGAPNMLRYQSKTRFKRYSLGKKFWSVRSHSFIYNMAWPALTYYFFILRYYRHQPLRFVSHILHFFQASRAGLSKLMLFTCLRRYGTRYLVYMKKLNSWTFVPRSFYRAQSALSHRECSFYTLSNRTAFLKRQERRDQKLIFKSKPRLNKYFILNSGVLDNEPKYKTERYGLKLFPMRQWLIRRKLRFKLRFYIKKLKQLLGYRVRPGLTDRRLTEYLMNNFTAIRKGLSRQITCLFFKKTRSNMYFTITNGLGEVRFSISAGRVTKSAKRSKKARASFYPVTLALEYIVRRLKKGARRPTIDIFYVPSHFKFRASKMGTVLYKNGIVPRRVIYTVRTPHSRYEKTKKARRL